jgi:hypothetical protein
MACEMIGTDRRGGKTLQRPRRKPAGFVPVDFSVAATGRGIGAASAEHDFDIFLMRKYVCLGESGGI